MKLHRPGEENMTELRQANGRCPGTQNCRGTLLAIPLTDARVFGTTDVNIRYFDYMPVSNAPTVVPDYSMMEAHYANH